MALTREEAERIQSAINAQDEKLRTMMSEVRGLADQVREMGKALQEHRVLMQQYLAETVGRSTRAEDAEEHADVDLIIETAKAVETRKEERERAQRERVDDAVPSPGGGGGGKGR